MPDADHDDATGAGEVVGAIESDRYCDRCGASLLGRAILREPRYGMMLSRCAACDAPAPSQLHPRILHREARWAALLAAMWLWFVAFSYFGGTALVFAFSGLAATEASNGYATFLQERFEAQRGRAAPVQAAGRVVVRRGADESAFAGWWAQQDPDALFAEAGGWRDAVLWRSLNLWWISGSIAAGMGVLWSLLMPGLGRRGREAWMVLVIALFGLLTVIVFRMWAVMPPLNPSAVGMSRVSGPLLVASVVVGILGVGVGLAFGRGLARRAARIVLPVRLHGAVSALWRIDGLPAPPGAAGAGARSLSSRATA